MSDPLLPPGSPTSPAAGSHSVANQPKWFTPARLLLIFCCANLVVYLDRGLIASNGVNGSQRSTLLPNGSGIQGAFGLSKFQDGLLPAMFMLGLLISSPVFAESCKHYNAFRLLGLGMAVWSAAVVGCGLSPNFALLLIFRAFVGIGEASFVALAAPFIDDYAPPGAKTQWFAVFYLCIPVGFAFGYIFGALVAGSLGWRWGFILEGLAMVPFVLFALTAKPIALQGSVLANSQGGEEGYTKRSLRDIARETWADVRKVLAQRVWVTICLAYTQYVAVLGVYAYWGPQAGKELFFGVDDESGMADYVFGGVTVLTGVLGSLAGGLVLDKAGSSLRNGNLLCAASNLVGFVFLMLAFNVSRSFSVFMVLFALGQFVIFLLQAPIAGMSMWCVPPALRPLGASLMTVSIHLFGDVPSPPFLGWLQSQLSKGKSTEDVQQWRVSLSIITLLLVGSGVVFLRGAQLSASAVDYRNARADDSQANGEAEADEEGGKAARADSSKVGGLTHQDKASMLLLNPEELRSDRAPPA